MTGSKSDGSVTHSQPSDEDDVRLYFPQAFTTDASPAAAGSGQTPEPDPEQMYDSMYDADAEENLMDMGLQIGRLSISERYVSFVVLKKFLSVTGVEQ